MTKVTDKNGKVWDKDSIQNLLQTSDEAVKRALKHIYNRQTLDEQQTEDTLHHNNIGFTGSDAKFMTSVYKFYVRNNYISVNQMYRVRIKIKKYWRQLLHEIERNNS